MSTIVEADETGTLRLPASLLPHPGPHRRYRVATGNGRVVVDEVEPVPPQCAVETDLGEGCFLGIPEPREPTGFVRKWGGSAKKIADEGDAWLARINEKHLR